jgi:hypothetical protein
MTTIRAGRRPGSAPRTAMTTRRMYFHNQAAGAKYDPRFARFLTNRLFRNNAELAEYTRLMNAECNNRCYLARFRSVAYAEKAFAIAGNRGCGLLGSVDIFQRRVTNPDLLQEFAPPILPSLPV